MAGGTFRLVKIALVQLHENRDPWRVEAIPTYLDAAAGVDLVVFPEFMPFYAEGKKIPKIRDAESWLSEQSRESNGVAFIAGGYVQDGKRTRNAIFLVHEGKVEGRYFKRIPWKKERFVRGEKAECFRWAAFSCVPLICADVDEPSPVQTRMMYEAIQAGAGKDTPIVVCSYGEGLQKPGWRSPLRAWAKACGAPVAICGFSGRNKHNGFGGGGSGMFWPNGFHTEQPSPRGIYIVNTNRRAKKMASRAIPPVPTTE